jgi:hypothetical protein
MKNYGKKMLIVLAILMSLVAVQAASGQETFTVSGTVYSVNSDNSITIDDGSGSLESFPTVYCIPVTYLVNKKIVVAAGTQVSVEVYERTFSDSTTKLIAVSLTVEGVAVNLPGKNPNRR